MHVPICTEIHMYIHTYMYAYMHRHRCMYMYIYSNQACIRTYTLYIYIHIHVYEPICTCTCVRVYIHVYIVATTVPLARLPPRYGWGCFEIRNYMLELEEDFKKEYKQVTRDYRGIIQESLNLTRNCRGIIGISCSSDSLRHPKTI